MDSYWSRMLEQRASRRAVVAGGASLAGAAALLAACGGDSGGGAVGSGPKAFTETKAEGPVKTGGIYARQISADLDSLDPYRQTAAGPNTSLGAYVFNRVVNFKTGPGVDPNSFEAVGDLAESWEVSNGGLTYTFKLRKGVKFHNIAPVNGRVLDSEDVNASYKRFSVGLTGGVGATTVGKAGSPSFGNSFKGVVDSVSAPDKDTVVFKLTKPNAAFLSILGAPNFLHIFPREADVSYDPLKTVIGTGAWIVSNVVPSVRLEYKRNPDYFDKGLPYMDGVTTYVIPEAAQVIAQFRAGTLHQYTSTSFAEFQAMVSDMPGIRLLPSGVSGSTQGIGFGSKDPNGPFMKDVRLRRAMSITIDRTTMMDEFNDLEKYKSIGLPREFRLGNFVPANLSTYWIDPRGKEMGDGAQWFQYDPQKAKQLVSAAGYPNGFDFLQKYASRNTGPSLETQGILSEYWAAAGMRSKIVPEDYASLFNPHSWHGETEGVAVHSWQTFGDPAQQLDYLFGPTSTRNQMQINDPIFNEMQDRNLAELDIPKRRAIIVEMMVYLAGEMRHVPYGWGTVESYILHQPQVRNNFAYRGEAGPTSKYWWLAS